MFKKRRSSPPPASGYAGIFRPASTRLLSMSNGRNPAAGDATGAAPRAGSVARLGNLCSALSGHRREVAEHAIISRQRHVDELLIGAHKIAAAQDLGVGADLEHRAHRLQPVAPNIAIAHVKD